MKKGLTKILALCAVVVASAAVFAGCGEAAPAPTGPAPETSAIESNTATVFEDEGVAGTWKVASMIVDGEESTLEKYCADNNLEVESLDVIMTLNEDGTGTNELLGVSVPLNYEVDENEITIISEVPQEDGSTKETVAVYTYDAENGTLTYLDKAGENGSVMTKVDMDKRV